MLMRLAVMVVVQSDRDFMAVTRIYFVSKLKRVNLISEFLPKVLF